MKKVIKPETFLRIGEFDVTELAELVDRLSDKLWSAEDERKENKFSVFHHTQHIIFRFPPGNKNPTEFYTNPIWEIWKDRLLPLMEGITNNYGHTRRQYSKIMLARLLAGHKIERHVDGAGANLLTHKVHVPLITNQGALFTIENETRHLEYGTAYEVNNIVRHAAENNGEEHRVHLIFEHFDEAA